MTDDILYEAHGHVRLITIDRADKMNSLDFAANDRLIERSARSPPMTRRGSRSSPALATVFFLLGRTSRSTP